MAKHPTARLQSATSAVPQQSKARIQHTGVSGQVQWVRVLTWTGPWQGRRIQKPGRKGKQPVSEPTDMVAEKGRADVTVRGDRKTVL